jgi:hypothetical protein
MALGGGSATPKGQTHLKKKKKKNLLGPWGWPIHPQGPRGGFGHPRPAIWGGRSHPFAILGWPATPFGMAGHPLYFFKVFFFFFFITFVYFYSYLNLFLKNNKILVSGLATSAFMRKIWRFDCKKAFLFFSSTHYMS